MLKPAQRVRYIGHTTSCQSCILAWPARNVANVANVAKVFDVNGLDDDDVFGHWDPWDERLDKLATTGGWFNGETVGVKFDGELDYVNVYQSHLEPI